MGGEEKNNVEFLILNDWVIPNQHSLRHLRLECSPAVRDKTGDEKKMSGH
jgi:hypothetical protein